MQKTQIGFEFDAQLNVMLDGEMVDDVNVHVIVSADVAISNERQTGGLEKEARILNLEMEYIAELPEDFCLETFGHKQNVFELSRKQILNHPNIQELIQDHVNNNH